MIPPTKFGLDCSSWKWAWFLAVREVACPYHKEGHSVVHLNISDSDFHSSVLCSAQSEIKILITSPVACFHMRCLWRMALERLLAELWESCILHILWQLPWEALIASPSVQSSGKKAFPHNLKKLYRCSYMVFPLLSYFLGKTTLLLLLLSRFSRVWLCATPQTVANQAPLSMGFSRQEHWSGLPFPSPMRESSWEGCNFVNLLLFFSNSDFLNVFILERNKHKIVKSYVEF